ncbi:MAG: nucleoside hydrolase [Chloroflexi bacterium]|nr:nucleoside hydrolase [Chloroflexota bacterium]
MTSTRIIIDTDPGVDDALTILLALASPEIELEALTTTQGNVTIENATRNALSVLELAGAANIPVARGSSLPLVQPLRASGLVHGITGLGRSNLPEPKNKPLAPHAIDFLIERFLAEPGELSLFAIGPLTNLALAIRKEPRFAKSVRELVIMGGAIREGGNVTPLAEFNIYVDPHAAHIVFHSGIPIILIPLDVTHKCILNQAHIDRLARIESPISRFIADAVADYLKISLEWGQAGCALHDPLTLATIIAPDLLTLRECAVDVDISTGVSMGKTFADFTNRAGISANMKVAMEVRGGEFIDLFLQRMENLSRAVV